MSISRVLVGEIRPRNLRRDMFGSVFGSLIFFGSIFGAQVAKADGAAACYRYSTADVATPDDNIAPVAQTWCYRKIENPAGAWLVYHVDSKGRSRPETSVMVRPDGIIAHATIADGEVKIHHLQGRFNPLGVPLTPPVGPSPGVEMVPEPISPQSAESQERTIDVFRVKDPGFKFIPLVGEGEFQAESTKKPWRGFWWPHKSGRLHNDTETHQSPMKKIDIFMTRRTKIATKGQTWESRNHRWTGVAWAGHCNGWAAAAIMRDEPTNPITDPITGVTFSVSDLKGLWLEASYCPTSAFYGHRFYAKKPGNPRDINPADFHQALTYYLGQLKKPVLMDYKAENPVENRVVSAYKMKIKKVGENVYDVRTELTVHTYDMQHTEDTGVAPSKAYKYSYRLYTDDQGNIERGTWFSWNPDFIWVPLAEGECDSKNPLVDAVVMNELYKYDKGPVAPLPPVAPGPIEDPDAGGAPDNPDQPAPDAPNAPEAPATPETPVA